MDASSFGIIATCLYSGINIDPDTDEEASVSCYGKSPQILRALLDECCIEYSKLVQGKTSLFEHQNSTWTRSVVSDIRPTSTVILHERVKRELLKDIGASSTKQLDNGIPTGVFLTEEVTCSMDPWDWKVKFEFDYRWTFYLGHLHPQTF
jgi:hypothetical protein